MTAIIPADNVLPAAIREQADKLVQLRMDVEDCGRAISEARARLPRAERADADLIREAAVKGRPMPDPADANVAQVNAELADAVLRHAGLSEELAIQERKFTDALGEHGPEYVALATDEMDSAAEDYQAAIAALLPARQRYIASLWLVKNAIETAAEHAYFNNGDATHFEVMALSEVGWLPRTSSVLDPTSWQAVDGNQLESLLRHDSARHER